MENYLSFKLILGGLLFLVFFGCETSPPIRDLTSPGGSGKEKISFSIAKRYGLDANKNGVIDMPNSKEYVNSPLDATLNGKKLAQTFPSVWPYEQADGAGFNSTVGIWRWTFMPKKTGSVPQGLNSLPVPKSELTNLNATNDGQKIITYTKSLFPKIKLFEGDWIVELARVDTNGKPIYWKTIEMKLSDILIVQLGDSYSSGEGAPDRDKNGRYWGDDGKGGNGKSPEFHRSSKTWGSVAAAKIESYSSQASVTYLNLARSGAVIDDVKDQLSEMKQLIGNRKVDDVFISIGGNDIGFSHAIIAYLLRENVQGVEIGPSLEAIREAVRTGKWNDGKLKDVDSYLAQIFTISPDINWDTRRGLHKLDNGYKELLHTLLDAGIDAKDVFILQYPDPYISDPLNKEDVCGGPVLTNTILTDVLGRQMKIGKTEQRHARQYIMTPLNSQIAWSAREYQWNVIACEKTFYSHAICNDDRWVIRFKESVDLQGDNYGTMHPNAAGYAAIANEAVNTWFKYQN